MLSAITGCTEEPETVKDETYPDFPIGLNESTMAWINQHRDDWSTWEQQAASGEPVGRYLHALRLAEAISSDTRRHLFDAASSGLSEGRMTLGLWLMSQPTREAQLEGLSWVREAAIRDLPVAQWEMSKAYREGKLVPVDKDEEARYASLAALAGLEAAVVRVAELCVSASLEAEQFALQFEAVAAPDRYVRCALGSVWLGSSETETQSKGRELLEKAFQEGLPQAASVLGLHTLDLSDDPAGVKNAIEWLERANVGGDDSAAFVLTRAYRMPEMLEIQPAEARQKQRASLEVAAARGSHAAQYALALLLEGSDKVRAKELFERAWAGGFIPAWADVQRHRFPESPRAVELELRSAASRQDPYACLALALLIDQGSVSVSAAEKRAFAAIAFEGAGSSRAALILGKHFLDAESAEYNPVEGTRWLTTAALHPDEPSIEAVKLLTNAYKNGTGVPPSPEMVKTLESRLEALAQ
jgi:TPR repeat protein